MRTLSVDIDSDLAVQHGTKELQDDPLFQAFPVDEKVEVVCVITDAGLVFTGYQHFAAAPWELPSWDWDSELLVWLDSEPATTELAAVVAALDGTAIQLKSGTVEALRVAPQTPDCPHPG